MKQPSGSPVIRVLIAEDETALRDVIAALVEEELDMVVIGAVGTADEAVERAAVLRPDVAVVDVRMPGGGPLAARGIKDRSPQTQVLALSASEDQRTVLEMLRAGAIGYLTKGISAAEIVDAIRRAVRKQASISIVVLSAMIDQLSADAGKRRETEAELRRGEDRFRALLDHLVTAGEEQRQRIANDIHDDSIQVMTAAGMRLQILRRRLDGPEQIALLDDLEQTIQLSIARLRHLLFELRPPALDAEGLSAALQLYLDEGAGESEARYRLEDTLVAQPDERTRVILYRIAQEAVTNIRKHAGAANVTISLQERHDGYFLEITDDGPGFSMDGAEPVAGHLGMAAMRERAILAGGWLKLEAAPGAGTRVEAWVPGAPGVRAAPATP